MPGRKLTLIYIYIYTHVYIHIPIRICMYSESEALLVHRHESLETWTSNPRPHIGARRFYFPLVYEGVCLASSTGDTNFILRNVPDTLHLREKGRLKYLNLEPETLNPKP